MSITREEFIDPGKAKEFLARNHPRNRPISRVRVERFKDDMLNGRWEETHQGVAFDDEGNLIDGQHRLVAVIEGGVGIKSLVTTGLKKQSFAVLDTGGIRKDFERGFMGGRDMTSECSSMLKIAMRCGNIQGIRLHDIETLFDKAGDGLAFVAEHCPARKVPAPIRAAVLRAFYNVERSRLVEFCNVLVSSEVSSNGDGAAVKLCRAYESFDMHGSSARRQLYLLAERAIQHFVQYSTPGVLKPVTAEQFPFPWETNTENGKAK